MGTLNKLDACKTFILKALRKRHVDNDDISGVCFSNSIDNYS